MTARRLKRPRDPIQLGKLIVEIAAGQLEDQTEDGKNPAAVALGRRGGLARAKSLTAKERKASALKASKAAAKARTKKAKERKRRRESEP